MIINVVFYIFIKIKYFFSHISTSSPFAPYV